MRYCVVCSFRGDVAVKDPALPISAGSYNDDNDHTIPFGRYLPMGHAILCARGVQSYIADDHNRNFFIKGNTDHMGNCRNRFITARYYLKQDVGERRLVWQIYRSSGVIGSV